MTTWRDDPERMAQAIARFARFLTDAQDNAERTQVGLNHYAKVHGHDFDRRADRAEGAQGAYGIALHALRGALQTDIADLIADIPSVERPMARPVLPGELIQDPDTTGPLVTEQPDDATTVRE